MRTEFLKYHNQHPEIWEVFKQKSLEAINKGFKNYSSKGIFELIRWHTGGDIKKDGFKIKNDFTPDYARYFELQYPQYKGFFRMKQLKTEV